MWLSLDPAAFLAMDREAFRFNFVSEFLNFVFCSDIHWWRTDHFSLAIRFENG